jgi:uncharacterized DUF497 family protein
MIAFDRIIGFEWDADNVRKNEKPGVSQSESEQMFFDPQLLMVADATHSTREPRYHALGMTLERRHLHIVFTLRANGTLIRVISVRDMHRKEKEIYGRED